MPKPLYALVIAASLALTQGCSTFGGAPAYGGGGAGGGQYSGGYTDNPYNDPYGSPFGYASAAYTPQAAPAQAGNAGSGGGFFDGFRDKMAKIFLGSSNKSFGTWAKERLTPRPLKKQVFGTPNAVNQAGEDLPVDEALRELRNGTRAIRTKERFEAQQYALNARAHHSNFDVPKPKGSSYGQGFNDGCMTFMSAVGKGPWRLVDHKRMDAPRMVTDNWYLRGYNDGADFCSSRSDWDMH